MNAPFTPPLETVTLADLTDPGELARIERFVVEREGTPFHRPAWLRAVERGTGQRALGLIAERGGNLTGWLPVTEVRSPLFPPTLVSSAFAVGGGAVADSEATVQQLTKAAIELAQRLSCSSVELRCADIEEGWRQVTGKHANFAAPLAESDDAQLLAIPRKQRAEVRKGLQQPFAVTVGTSDEDRRKHYAVYCESVRNLGTPVFPRALFDAVLDGFGSDADILTISLEHKPVAAVLTVYHRGVAYPYWGGGTHAARASRANERLYFELMGHARRRGCGTFDFGRSKVGSGAFAYKKNWGFTPEPLTYAIWQMPGEAARDIDPTSEVYSGKIALWKRLPLPVANRLGPIIARGLA
ncbi:FemAB family XrtA/PEP-CTERM system-associated protein [Parafrankia sp. BMG5.11]|uniref:FemAB family XrtA/PEP-CTERM system-associated protein n=1 Tax=Parafrankia sp. BMG5.11 TaxID=222540 RepID=UPI00103EAF8D|nr:FemAB family XrtA/PEP-CTERM system-associated protein [Parafrankia sp. BMG5.11]TCJ37444.1 FemAB family PEP-CTERM system-associated protein [Parafrankia sp. BMG5.11]